MSNLNPRKTPRVSKRVVNHESNVNFATPAKGAFVSMITTSFVDDKFYASKDEVIDEVRGLIRKLSTSDPEFILKAAAYARQIMNMRSFPQIVLVEAAVLPPVKPFVKKWAPLIMQRADEPSEVLAYHLGTYGKPIPNSLKRAIAARIENFSPYQLAKYQRKGSEVSLADAIKLTHPRLGEVGKQILEGTAKADTWEAKLSSTKGEDKAKAWEEMIPKMGYMALLRNLRNFINEDLDIKLINQVAKRLADSDEVKRSRQLPFRFYSAYRELEKLGNTAKVRKLLKAVSSALDSSVVNFEIPGKTLVVADSSGSMSWSTVSSRSTVTLAEIAGLMGVSIASIADDCEFWSFDDQVYVNNFNFSEPILSNMSKLHSRGGGTRFDLVMERLNAADYDFDTVIILSDMQVFGNRGWCGSASDHQAQWKAYKKRNPEARMFSVDMNSYNRGTPIDTRANDVALIAGWSDKVIDLISTNSAGLADEIDGWNPFE